MPPLCRLRKVDMVVLAKDAEADDLGLHCRAVLSNVIQNNLLTTTPSLNTHADCGDLPH